jgi:hypothetical protein
LGSYRLFAYGALIVVAMLVRPFGFIDQNLVLRLRRWGRRLVGHGGGPDVGRRPRGPDELETFGDAAS